MIILFRNLIENYINNMNINDLIEFSHKENIFLENQEYLEIYNYIKNNWTLLISNTDLVKTYLESNFNNIKSKQIYDVYLKYHKKYSAYL